MIYCHKIIMKGVLKMTVGDINRIDITWSSFKDIISDGKFYVDKTKVIEDF